MSVACSWMRSVHKILYGNPEGKRRHGRSRWKSKGTSKGIQAWRNSVDTWNEDWLLVRGTAVTREGHLIARVY
jgi:hypothetical protein